MDPNRWHSPSGGTTTRKKLEADRSSIIYSSQITLSGIPAEAYRYMLGSRSAIEWIMDRYQVKTDKASGIVNNPNDWSKEGERSAIHPRSAREGL